MAKQSKHIATVSLGVMAAGFAATFPVAGTVWGGLLQGGFEAGLVGGLADWFAVTALFRHPLGLPIPHTSLLTRNRSKLTQALVSAVENELLHPKSISSKLKQFRFTENALLWAENELTTDSGKAGITALCAYIVEHLPYDKIADLMEHEANKLFDGFEPLPLYGKLTEQILERGWDETAFDYVLDKAEAWVLKLETRNMLGAMALQALGNIQLGGFMGFAMGAFSGFMTEDKLGDIVQGLLFNTLRDLRKPGSKNRTAIIGEIRTKLKESRSNPGLSAALDQMKQSLLETIEPGRKIRDWVDQAKERLIAFVQSPDFAETFALPLLLRTLQRVRSDEQLLGRAESWVQEKLLALVDKHYKKIGGLVKENVDKLDNDTLIAMLEDKVGKDLQWIRVNGAVCGFVIGIFLTLIRMFI